ncbi:MAG: hypothetical protein ACHQ7N_15765 [Candidatus Methylomirabilales bacterium]
MRVYVIHPLHERGTEYPPGASLQTTPERAQRLAELKLVSLQPQRAAAKPMPTESPEAAPTLAKGRTRNRQAELLGALCEALHRNVQRHCPALANAFDLEVDRIQAHRKKAMLWGDEEDPAVAAIRGIVIGSLRGRRQLKDPHEHLDLLVAHRGFHQCMVMMRRAWRAASLPLLARLDMLENILPLVAQHLGFTRRTPPRDTDDPNEITLGQIAQKEDPTAAAYLLLSHYSRHTPETVREYVKRARRAFAKQGLSWKELIRPFPAK